MENLTYCGNWPDRDHAACPSSVECMTVTVADIPPAAPVALPIGAAVTDPDLGAGTVVRSAWPLVAVSFPGVDVPVWISRRALTVDSLPAVDSSPVAPLPAY
jgi:hypothetical protein